MSVTSRSQRRKLVELQRAEARLRNDVADHSRDEGKAREKATTQRAKAERASSPAARRSALRRAEAADKKASKAAEKTADASKRIARNTAGQQQTRDRLDTAERSERRQSDRAEDRRDAQRRRRELAHARAVARAAHPPNPLPQPEPSVLRVLYLTASPEATEREITYPDGTRVREGVWLRVDAEVAQVRRALRGSRYRDLVDLHHRPAATTDDLFDGLNDLRPHAVHFSGHADPAGVLMDNGSAEDPEGVDLSFEVLADILAATSTPPTLVVLNACSSLAGVEPLLQVVPIVIAMSDTINDAAAVVFAQKFWAALAAAQPVSAAYDQAKAAMRAAFLDDDAELPELRCRPDVDPAHAILIQP
jgi:hypothetical protein